MNRKFKIFILFITLVTLLGCLGCAGEKLKTEGVPDEKEISGIERAYQQPKDKALKLLGTSEADITDLNGSSFLMSDERIINGQSFKQVLVFSPGDLQFYDYELFSEFETIDDGKTFAENLYETFVENYGDPEVNGLTSHFADNDLSESDASDRWWVGSNTLITLNYDILSEETVTVEIKIAFKEAASE